MAPFNPGLNPTSDPNYLNASRGYSKSDVPVDTSLGKLFANVGDFAGDAVKAVDFGIQDSIKTDLQAAINPIRDAAGASVTPDEAVAIAGKGSRGARYATAVGAGLPTDDLGADNATLPTSAKRNIQGLQRLQSAYDQGQLSNTEYYAQLAKVVKDEKLQHPGYTDQIDSMVSSITGVNPANALRSSVLLDMNSMAAAQSGSANKIATQYHTDNGYIQALFPGMTVDQYGQNKSQVDVEVGKVKARQLNNTIQEQELTVMDKKDARTSVVATQSYTNKINTYMDTFVSGAVNGLREKSEALLQQGANADPKAVQQLQEQYQALRSTIKGNFDQMARTSIGGSENSYSTYLKPDQIKAAQDGALSSLDIVAQNLGIDAAHSGVANSASNILKNRHSQDLLRMEDKFPTVRGIVGIGKELGPQFSALMAQQTQVLPDVTRAIVENAWGNIAHGTDGQPQTVSDALNALPKGSSGRAMTVTVQGLKEMAKNPQPEVAARAVEALYGDPHFFANVAPSDKAAVYKSLTSKDMVQTMSTLKDSNPQAYQTWKNWVTQNAIPVYKQGIDDLQSATEYNRYDVQFDPKSGHFSATTKPQYSNPVRGLASPTGAPFDPASTYVSKINELSDRLMPVLKAEYGDQAPQQFLQIIKQAGYDPSKPQHGTWLEGLGTAVSGVVKGAVDNLSVTPQEANPYRTQSAPDQRSSILETTRTAESGGNYNAVFGHPAGEFPLTQMTVGEVRHLQSGLKAQGAESTATGAYQFLGKTVDSLVKSGVVSPDEPFTAKTQDKMAMALLERRGLSDFESGKISKEQFLNNIAKEWAGLPTTSGRSFYEGVGRNHATISLPTAMAMFLKKHYHFDFAENPPPQQG